MKHLASKHSLLFLIGLLAAIPLAASPVLHRLNIQVQLHDNGDADITELRQMSIDSEGTECYIVIGNLNGSDILDFSVSDESGRKYTYEGEWDVDRSRQEKAMRCGVVTKSDGYELCWGLGDSGERNYTVNYTVTRLVRSYSESDGFNYMFVARDVRPCAEEATVTILAPKEIEGGFPHDSIGIWSFGYHGSINKVNGKVVATTSEPMTPESAMIVMMELQKGILHPAKSLGGSFNQVREEAFEGSDYNSEGKGSNVLTYIKERLVSFLIALFLVVLMIFGIVHKLSIRKARKKLERDVNWYRDIPKNNSLNHANNILQAYNTFSDGNKQNLLSAMVLRLIRTGALRIETHYIAPSGFKKIFGGEGKDQQCIVIGNFNTKNKLLNWTSLQKLYDIFSEAAGDDRILQPKELRKWMRNNQTEVMDFLNFIKPQMSLKEVKKDMEEVEHVFGLRKFLNDFTLANERHLSEVALWNDYLVYATLFGIGDQVMEDMKTLNPEFLEMNEITRNLTDRNVVPSLISATYLGSTDVIREQSRSSGGGGSSSFGGGGGFSGGGSGGGVR